MSERFLRPRQVSERVGYGIRHVNRKAADPDDPFPSSMRLSDRCTVWIESEVEQWIDDQIRRHRAPRNGDADAPDDAPGDAPKNRPSLKAGAEAQYGLSDTFRASRGRRKGKAG